MENEEPLTKEEIANLEKEASVDFNAFAIKGKIEDYLTADIFAPHEINARISFATNTKTKSEVIEIFEGLCVDVSDTDDTPLAIEMMRNIKDSAEFFAGLAKDMEIAYAKLSVANANHILKSLKPN